MRVLVACEESGMVREAFRRKGHDAWSCDTQPTSAPGTHFQCDIKYILGQNWDLMIAHPPCTFLSNSGVRWLETEPGRKEKLKQGAEFFMKLWEAKIPMIAVENPIMHKYAIELIGGRKPDQILQPWFFDHGETKATCLWLKGLPPLMSTVIHTGRKQRMAKLPPSDDRAKLRSKTYPHIAEAMANQWG